MSDSTLTVSELMAILEGAIGAAVPGPLWVRGEVTGFRRTSGGAAFFRLADPNSDETSLEVSARGRVMFTIDRTLASAAIGQLRDGIEIRAQGTVGIDRRQSRVRLTLLEVDPAFTAGRLAMERAEVLRRMAADGSLEANRRLEFPLVPLHVGLVASRGSAAHADFIEHLQTSGLRFSVRTAHTSVQGGAAPVAVTAAIERVAAEPVDVIAVIRGGGSKLDLSVFDSELVGRAISASPVPVITGIGHEIDRTVADEVAAVYQKTPTAASEWLVTRVQEFANRIDSAREHIRVQALASIDRAGNRLRGTATALMGARGILAQQGDRLGYIGDSIAASAKASVLDQRRRLDSLREWFSTIGVDQTLERGFALVTTRDGQTVIRSVDQLTAGHRALIRLKDGTVPVIVDPDE